MDEKWNAKFGFFWYNDDEIFKFTKLDFDDKARKLAESGINIVITFSCTHFRWSMKQHWDIINKCLANIVGACHAHNIKVVEHHSSHLTFDPLDDDEWDYMERVLGKRLSSIDSWEGLREYAREGNTAATAEYRQIDGRTGHWARSSYKGWCMCFNNPGYRKEYFEYLEKLYAITGVDGIMTDDVQYFGAGHACACSHCRGLFEDETGYVLPAPGREWERFHGDFDNPAYVAWEKFKRNSTLRFHEDVTAHFKDLGLELLRPNYVSGNIAFNWTGYAFEKALHLWDWVFQENCFSYVIKHSWPQFLTEAAHRFNMGRLADVPSMSMFYPDRFDSFYFAWSLSMAWGQLFTATPEGEDICEIERKFREFEVRHRNILAGQKKKADVTVYWSYETANYCDPGKSRHITAVKSWTQALVFAGYSTDMVFACESKIDRSVHGCLLVPDARMMGDGEFEKIYDFAREGGTVVYTGKPGERKPDGTYRSGEELERIQGLPSVPPGPDGGSELFVGKGRIMRIGETGLDNDYYEPLNVDRWQRTAGRRRPPGYKAGAMAAEADRILGPYILKSMMPSESSGIVNCYMMYDADERNVLIHIINAAGTLDDCSHDAGHSDKIPAFERDAAKTFKANIRIRIPGASQAYLVSPEFDEEISLVAGTDGEWVEINIPDGLFSGYAIVRIPFLEDGRDRL
ncbi:MAG: hypothetical protein JXB33_01640 [Clostridia bacterium]|nr:hypothetical protein [Clostridia bacterium]